MNEEVNIQGEKVKKKITSMLFLILPPREESLFQC